MVRTPWSRDDEGFVCGDDVARGFCLAGLTRLCADLVSLWGSVDRRANPFMHRPVGRTVTS